MRKVVFPHSSMSGINLDGFLDIAPEETPETQPADQSKKENNKKNIARANTGNF